MMIKLNWIVYFALILFMLSAIVTYIHSIQHLISVSLPFSFLLNCLALSLIVFYSALSKIKLIFDLPIALLFVAFVLPLFLSSLIFSYSVVEGDQFYVSGISELEYIKRSLNLLTIIFFSYLVVIVGYQNSNILEFLVNNYFKLLLVVVVFVGVWQWFSIYFNIPFLDLGTKSHIHGVSGDFKKKFSFRLTSFFAEPSYYVSYIFDLIVINSYLMSRSKIGFKKGTIVLSLCFFLLFFTFSFSALIHLLLFLFFSFLLFTYAKGKLDLKFFLVSAFFLIVVLLFGGDSLEVFYNRFQNKILSGDDKRFFLIGLAYEQFYNFDIENYIFGIGPGQFAVFKYLLGYEGTTNNLYVDQLIENGFWGVISILLVIIMLFLYRLNQIKYSPEVLTAKMLFVNLVITGLYRADYSASKFWLVLAIFCLLHRREFRAKE